MHLPWRWLAVSLAPVFVLCAAHVLGIGLTEGDSRLYARIAHALALAPVTTWMSPQWLAHWYKAGPFEEHLAVFFWRRRCLGNWACRKCCPCWPPTASA